MNFERADLEELVFLVFSIQSGSYSLSTSSSVEFPESQGKGLDVGIPIRAECSKVSLLCNVWL